MRDPLKKHLSQLLFAAIAPAIIVPFLPPAAALPRIEAAPTTLAQVQPTIPERNIPLTLFKAILIAGGTAGTLFVLASFLFRRVVSANMVHVVQRASATVPYGVNQAKGNVYFEIPTWFPVLGVSVVKLPVSNFDLSLQDYEAYDEDRIPFLVDVTAFFRIKDPVIASQRVTDIKELRHQLSLIVQGAVRKVLASSKIDSIMLQRSTFGDNFSEEVEGQLTEWGVSTVRNMELMDIRDSNKSTVIHRIMAKKISEKEKDSRIAVAENERLATVAEVENKRTANISSIEAEKEVNLSKQAAEQEVGERSAAKDQAIGVAQEQSQQEILLQQAATKEKETAVVRVSTIRAAEIERDKAVVSAEQERQVSEVNRETALIRATVDKETTILRADGDLESERRKAEAIQVSGEAKAKAEEALLLAPVTAQAQLAKEIGENEGYQNYLTLVKALEAYMEVGRAQAGALQNADVKVIANGGSAPEGLAKVGGVFSSAGGIALAAAVESFAQSDIGAALLQKLTTLPQG